MKIVLTILTSIIVFISAVVHGQYITDNMDKNEAKNYFSSQLLKKFSNQKNTEWLINQTILSEASLDNLAGKSVNSVLSNEFIEVAVLFQSQYERIGFEEQDKILKLINEGDEIMKKLPAGSYHYKGRDFLAPVLVLLINQTALATLVADERISAITERNDEEGHAYILGKTTK